MTPDHEHYIKAVGALEKYRIMKSLKAFQPILIRPY